MMTRSQINNAIKTASAAFIENGWYLPPDPRWDVTDFGLGDFNNSGLVLVNLADEPEYCEKIMFAQKDQITPAHCHKKKKEDIIVRKGKLAVKVWNDTPDKSSNLMPFEIQINNKKTQVNAGELLILTSGERITMKPGIYHEFYPESEICIIGEVSTENDDVNDNFFINPDIGRYTEIEENEPPLIKLVSDK